MATANGREGDGSNGRGSAPASDAPPPIRARFPSDYAAPEFRQVQEQIIEAAERAGYRDKCLFAIKISVEEALVNAIKHGNAGDKTKHVIVEASISPERAEIMIEDEGPGFTRHEVPDPLAEENLEKPSGRGILLIESYMSKVSWDHGGRRVRMVKLPGDDQNLGCSGGGER